MILKRNFCINIFILFFTIVILLLLLEYWFVHFQPQKVTITLIKGENVSQFDHSIGYRYAPNITIRMTHPEFEDTRISNSWGFLDENFNETNNSKVMVLGDSFVEGWQTKISERITELAEKKLPEWKFINFGVGGYTICQELGVFREFKNSIHANVIAVFLYLGNDLDEATRDDRTSGVPRCMIQNSKVVIQPAKEKKSSSINYILNSHMWNFISNILKYNQFWIIFTQNIRNSTLERSLPFYEENASENTKDNIALVGAELNAIAEESGVPVLVFLIPDGFMADKNLHDVVEEKYSINLEMYNISLPSERLKTVVKKDVYIYDLTTDLREKWDEETYFFQNRHFTENGNDVAARVLVSSIRDHIQTMNIS